MLPRDFGPWSSVYHYFACGFDRNSNRLYREDLVAQAQSKNFDELYAYDGLDRLDDMKRGLLNSAHDAVTNVSYSTNWNLDAVGNWSNYSVSQTQGQMQQSRQHNKVNEITDIDSQPLWGTPQYDPAGNTTAFPQPNSPNLGFTAKYDAWNRLCKVTNPSIQSGATVAEYEYDARGFRIRRREYDASTGDYLRCYDDYYSNRWQLLETRVTTSVTAVATQVYEQYVWHASADAYIDQLLLRRRDTTDNGSLDETLIALQDAHYNVAALINTNGAVQERYAYSPYGERIILDASYGSRTTSSFGWRVGHQGLRHDEGTGMIYNRARILHAALGRFMQRDQMEYIDGLSLYLYYAGMLGQHDPSGLGCEIRFDCTLDRCVKIKKKKYRCEYTCTETSRITNANGILACYEVPKPMVIPSESHKKCCKCCPATKKEHKVFRELRFGDCSRSDCRANCQRIVSIALFLCKALKGFKKKTCTDTAKGAHLACDDGCDAFCKKP